MENSAQGTRAIIDTSEVSDGYIWVECEGFTPSTNPAPNANATTTIVLNNPAIDTDITEMLNLPSDPNTFLAQDGLHIGYMCSFDAADQGEEATVTFEYGDEEDPDNYGYMTLDATYDNGWVVGGVSNDSGFSGFVIN